MHQFTIDNGFDELNKVNIDIFYNMKVHENQKNEDNSNEGGPNGCCRSYVHKITTSSNPNMVAIIIKEHDKNDRILIWDAYENMEYKMYDVE